MSEVARRCISVGMLLLLPQFGVAGVQGAIEFVRIEEREHIQCAPRDGRMMVVLSTHPSESIEAGLDRFFMNVRQGDRSIVVLEPGGVEHELGCTRVLVDKSPQYWEVVTARFLVVGE